MHLRELEGRRTTISENDVMSRTPLREAHETDVLGQVRREGLETLILDPYEAKFVRLVF
jgi:hypothetical protein